MVEINVFFLRLDDEARNMQVIGESSALALSVICLYARSTANGHLRGETMQRDQHLTPFAYCGPTPTPLHTEALGGPLPFAKPLFKPEQTNKPPEDHVPSSDSQHFTSRSGNSHA